MNALSPSAALIALAVAVLLLLAAGRFARRRQRRIAELEEANRQLERLHGAKNDLLAAVAHDIKNPLSLIFGYAELIAEQGSQVRGLENIGRRMTASVQQILTLILDLMDSAALESGQLRLVCRPLALEDVAREALERIEPLAGERQISCRLEAPPAPAAAPWIAQADPQRIGRVLDNLLSNAVKYSNRGSGVSLRLAPGTDSDRVRLEVEDDGPGVSAGQRQQIFDRFVSLPDGNGKNDAPMPSNGLGLYIVRQLVELHGGQVGVDSRPGAGAIFWVELPRAIIPRSSSVA